MFETEIDPPAQSRRYTPRDYAVWLAGMLAVTMISAGCCGFVSWRDSRIAGREQTATGVITAVGHSLRNGPSYHYRFAFKERTYDGDNGGYDLEAGKTVTVYLDPDDPSANSLDDFRLQSKWKHSYAIFLAYVSIGLGFILLIRIKTLPEVNS
jgi:hypothetical protein